MPISDLTEGITVHEHAEPKELSTLEGEETNTSLTPQKESLGKMYSPSSTVCSACAITV